MVWHRTKRGDQPSGGTGCGYLMGLCLTIVLLLVINGLLVRAFVMRNTSDAVDLRVIQAIQFLAPIALIALEFWIFDRLTRNWHR